MYFDLCVLQIKQQKKIISRKSNTKLLESQNLVYSMSSTLCTSVFNTKSHIPTTS